MSSDEERLEEMLRAVMEAEETAGSDPDEWDMGDPGDIPIPDIPEMADELSDSEFSDELPDTGFSDELPDSGFSDELPDSGFSDELPDTGFLDELPEASSEKEMMVDPLALLDMSEDEIDHILEREGVTGEEISAPQESSDVEFPEMLDEVEGLSDMQGLFDMPAEAEDESADVPLEDIESLADEGTQEQEAHSEKPKKEKEKAPRKEKKKKEKKKEKKEKKDGLGKKLGAFFFGADEEEENADALTGTGSDGDAAGEEDGEQKKENGKAAKKSKEGKKKKEKKKEPDKKKGEDPKKAAKEKRKKEKNAEKAKKKAEKAEKAEKERRAQRKLPKKKVFVWSLLCASIGAGVLLMNSVGMDTLHLTEARNAFDDKDFVTAYQLMNGRILEEEDQVIFRQSSAILHLRHAKEAYENHLKLEKPVMALEDLLKGVAKYQNLSQNSTNLITPELTAEYQDILGILQENYGLSEAGAMEINALESDYEFSLQLEALVNGETYQSEEEMEQQQEEEMDKYADLEDILPEEEEYLNDSNN